MKFATSLGTGGLIGLLLGLALVAWVRPDTTGGQVMLILIMIALGGIVSGIWRFVMARLTPPKE